MTRVEFNPVAAWTTGRYRQALTPPTATSVPRRSPFRAGAAVGTAPFPHNVPTAAEPSPLIPVPPLPYFAAQYPVFPALPTPLGVRFRVVGYPADYVADELGRNTHGLPSHGPCSEDGVTTVDSSGPRRPGRDLSCRSCAKVLPCGFARLTASGDAARWDSTL